MSDLILFAAEGGSILTDTNFWSLVVFVLFVSLLAYVGLRPTREAMAGREETIVGQLQRSATAREDLADLKRRHESERKEMGVRMKEMVAEAQRDAERTREEMRAQAAIDAEKIKARARRETGLMEQKAGAEIWAAAADGSHQVAREQLRSGLSGDDHRRLIAAALDELAAVAGEQHR